MEDVGQRKKISHNDNEGILNQMKFRCLLSRLDTLGKDQCFYQTFQDDSYKVKVFFFFYILILKKVLYFPASVSTGLPFPVVK